MQFHFLNNAGKTLFLRNDALTALWTQEELSLSIDFPYDSEKVIQQGQWIAFKWLDRWEIFEIRNAKVLEPNHIQQITAEGLVISELTDEHIDESEQDDKRAEVVLNTVLSGTLWNVGEVKAPSIASADISRGSVWQAVNKIKSDWNVYIEPRYTLDNNGNIGRYLDILPSEGTFRGLRLAVDKNVTDTTVTIDDSNVITAIKGYGANQYNDEDEDDEGTPLTFAEAVWTATSTHPAKPYGDVWLIDTQATEMYGRNGRPRRGFYQNTSIDDATTLLEKSWEALNKKREPEIEITGTLTDLYRLGYADEPIRLHDSVIVEIKPDGFKMQREVIKLTVDLLDPSQTVPTIGDYIPNIIYINRDTEEEATGSSGGSSNGSGSSSKDDEFFTNILQNKYRIKLEAGQRIAGDVALYSSIEVTASQIRSEVNNYVDGLYSSITQTASQIRLEVKNTKEQLESSITQTASQIRLEVNNTKSELQSSITQTASQIRTEVSNTNSEIYSSITQTASQIRLEVSNVRSGLESSITQTASQIRLEVSNTKSELQSSITQTASQIRLEVSNTAAGLESSITQTASQIRAEVSSSVSGLQSSITQTASQIRAEVSDSVSGLQSSITQTASQIRAEVSSSENGIRSSITQTASQIRSEVVGKDGVISAINQTPESITIQASKINLSGYVTTSMMDSAFQDVQQMTVGSLTIANYLTCLGYNTEWKSLSFYRPKSLSASKYYMYGSSTTSTTGQGCVQGKLVTDDSYTTIYYLGR